MKNSINISLLSVKTEYDENGLRYKKESTVSGVTTETRYFLDGTTIIAEDRDGELIQYYYDSMGVIGMSYDGEEYFFYKDIFGNITHIINSDFTIVAQYEYDAWGNCEIITNVNGMADINPFRYRGYYMDTETGYYYLQSRYYDPALRRFISSDSYGLISALAELCDLNLYAYANNNPIRIAYSGLGIGGTSSSEMESSAGGSKFNGNGIGGTNSMGDFGLGSINCARANSVVMMHHTESLIKNPIISWIFGNISYINTVQLNPAVTFYSFSNIGDDVHSVGFGVNLGNWYGSRIYVSSDYGFGSSWQLTPWLTGSSGWSPANGVSISGGIIIGDTTHEITVSIGNGALLGYAICGWVATIPAPGARAVATTAACIILIVDLIN